MSDNPENRRKTESTFSTSYPYNQATVTRGGHEFHINDAPGKESLKAAHTTGTYVEIESDGAWRQVVTAKSNYYHKDGITVTSDGHVDTKVKGNYALNINNCLYTAVANYVELGMGGNYLLGIGGDYVQTVMGIKEETVTGTVVREYKEDEMTTVMGNKQTIVDGNRMDILNGDWQVASSGNIDINCDGNFKIKCKNFTVEAETITMTTSAGDVTITASGIVYINGTQIRLNDD